ncbi:hypothetical protein BGZ65_012908, partial [Modicella reniformis]
MDDSDFTEEYAILMEIEAAEADSKTAGQNSSRKAIPSHIPLRKQKIDPPAPTDLDEDTSTEELEVMVQTAMDEKRRLGDLIMDREDLNQDTEDLKREWRIMRDRISNLQPRLDAMRTISSRSSDNNKLSRGIPQDNNPSSNNTNALVHIT